MHGGAFRRTTSHYSGGAFRRKTSHYSGGASRRTTSHYSGGASRRTTSHYSGGASRRTTSLQHGQGHGQGRWYCSKAAHTTHMQTVVQPNVTCACLLTRVAIDPAQKPRGWLRPQISGNAWHGHGKLRMLGDTHSQLESMSEMFVPACTNPWTRVFSSFQARVLLPIPSIS